MHEDLKVFAIFMVVLIADFIAFLFGVCFVILGIHIDVNFGIIGITIIIITSIIALTTIFMFVWYLCDLSKRKNCVTMKDYDLDSDSG